MGPLMVGLVTDLTGSQRAGVLPLVVFFVIGGLLLSRVASSRREEPGQCRKCRMPVKTMARPAASAAAITSSSRIDPPGWMTAVAPASIAACRPSAKGKKASEATTAPRVSGSASPAPPPRPRLAGGDAGRIDPAHLAGADADGGAVAGVDDGVRLDVLGDAEGEQQVVEFARRWAVAW